uniref:Vacuolar ATPase assembly protein VMA22 n=1 Tax=Drosophila rhopaloa TaxID=1041015 RepID=A0A6P4F612_DRORH
MNHNEVPSDESKDPMRESRSEASDEDVRCLLDGLHLQMFHLMEDQDLLQLRINKQTCRAGLILARVRLHHGSERTSAEAQLPRGQPYKAITRVIETSSPHGKYFRITRHPIDPILRYFRPLTNIFGRLVPESLRVANRHWDHCLDMVVECANIRRELQSTIDSIKKLRRTLD